MNEKNSSHRSDCVSKMADIAPDVEQKLNTLFADHERVCDEIKTVYDTKNSSGTHLLRKDSKNCSLLVNFLLV